MILEPSKVENYSIAFGEVLGVGSVLNLAVEVCRMTVPVDETQAQPVEVTCPGCFHPREWDVAGVCPICHY
jgi:hypothetical protein